MIHLIFIFKAYILTTSKIIAECQCIFPPRSDNKVTSRLAPLDPRTHTQQILVSATGLKHKCLHFSNLYHLTCIPDEPQVAEQGPQALQAAESQLSRGHEGRRHLLNLSIFSGQLRPPPLGSCVTLLNLCRCP